MTPRSQSLDRFEALLTRHDSATAALEAWCRTEGIAQGQPIRAAVEQAGERELPPADRALLRMSGTQVPDYRHVRLTCGGTVLSEAHNWYVADRLRDDMRLQLADSDTPFGKIAAPLHFTRTILSSRRGGGAGCPAGTVLTQRAMLTLPDGRPLALLVECYTSAIIPRG
jgi:hypothetical protein